MRILLISPEYNAHIIAPHLGLGYLASSLIKNGHSVTVLDGVREKIKYDPNDFDYAGFSAMTTYFPEMVVEVKKAKRYGLTTIIGGAHVTADPINSLIQSGADFACVGEGEILVNELVSGINPDRINGLVRWSNGIAVQNQHNFSGNIDDFGQPAWNLIDPRTYPPAPHGMIARDFPLAPIITTRGCPYPCTYCSAPISAGKKMRYRDPYAVVEEIELLVKEYGVKEIQIEDDNFTINQDHVEKICNLLIEKNISIIWSLPNGVRIDRLNMALLKLMKKSGCYLMALGIETANQRILDLIKKKLKKNIVRETVEMVKKAGIEAWGFFMIGFPSETKEEIQKTIEFALSLPLDRVQFTKTTPLPGTEIYELWKKNYSDGLDVNWAEFNYYSFDANWSNISSAEISKFQKKGHLRFYLKPVNFVKVISRLRLTQYKFLIKRLFNLMFKPSD